jgi:hypothetical protein
MPRDATPLTIADLNSFARALRLRLAENPGLPGHQALLGHLAVAAGYRNWQHLRAVTHAPAPAPGPDPAALKRLERALQVFDDQGRMRHWPSGTALQGLCLWPIWSRLPADRNLDEGAVNQTLKDGHLFGDHVLLRRSLIDHGLVSRSADCRVYRRIEQAPPPEALLLLRRVRGHAPA